MSPNQHLIFCADSAQFANMWGEHVKGIAIETLAVPSEGGFMVLSTGNFDHEGEDMFCFGKPEITTSLVSQLGVQNLEFLLDGSSYVREFVGSGSGTKIGLFKKAVPTPGK